MSTIQSLIQVTGLVKRYGSFEALKGITFDVAPGEVFGILGPNGSGKTTTLEILEGLRPRCDGQVLLAGRDPEMAGFRAQSLLGGQLQRTLLPGRLTVIEIFRLFASFHARPADILGTLGFVGLQEFRYHFFDNLSGGQQQRVALGLTLLGKPEVLFLDEPTMGLDPKIRMDLHALILALKAQGKTILLTTHYIEEAEKLCDRVAILVKGSIRAIGAPKAMIEDFMGLERIMVEMENAPDPGFLAALDGVARARVEDRRATLYSSRPTSTLLGLVKAAEASGNRLIELKTARPTLEDVYLKVVGSEA